PRIPVDHAAIALAKDYAEKLSDLALNHPQDYTWLLDYFVNHAWNQSTDLIFRQTSDAQRYLQILSHMQVAQKHIVVTWYHGKDIPQMTNTQRKKHWKTSLNMAKNRKILSKKLNNTRKLGEYGWLGIRLLDYISDKHQDGKSTYAFRFVLLMMAMGNPDAK
ncbi:MAG: hypothetical protein Q9M19_07695, partial [Mariprofundaceae bacterium]|nr:hypothetical protein [Mariprofundaceae bacterium]